ncbi:hypothetical protein K1719_043403 [Acacia pycnantha]|nr:hypothetical protein K1719_043403 [Acacia pycnantha]
MGNCQAAEAATVVIQHPGNKIERIYWSVSAHHVMNSNPGHYVALVVTSPNLKSENGAPLKQLKLLRPDDTLLMGQVYRLISFEDVLKELAPNPSPSSRPDFAPMKVEQEIHRMGSNGSSSSSHKVVGRQYGGGGGQWRPALQSIEEVGN